MLWDYLKKTLVKISLLLKLSWRWNEERGSTFFAAVVLSSNVVFIYHVIKPKNRNHVDK